MRTAILKSSGKEYKIMCSYETGTKEENDAKMNNGKSYSNVYDTTIYYCRILKNGKPFGATRLFKKEQLDKITE